MSAVPTRLHLIVPVWGDHHVSLFLEVGLPSLLADGNLPVLAARFDLSCRIYTRDEDRERLERSAAIAALRPLAAVTFEPISTTETGDPHLLMSDAHRRGIAAALEADAGAVFLPPDCVFADGSLTALADRIADEADMVHMSGVRLDSDTATPDLVTHWRSADALRLAIPPRALVRLGLRQLHAIAEASVFDSPGGRLMPANLFWRVGDTGLHARCYHLHPLFLRPNAASVGFSTTIDDDLALVSFPDGAAVEHVVQDSDEILAFELSRPSHRVETGYASGSVRDVAAWAEIGANGAHRKLARLPIRLHAEEIGGDAWDDADAAAARVIAEADRYLTASAPWLLFSAPRNFWHRSLAVLRDRPVRADGVSRPAQAVRLAAWALRGAPYLAAQGLVAALTWASRLPDRPFGVSPSVRPWHWRWHLERDVVRPLIALVETADGPVLFVDAPDRPIAHTLRDALRASGSPLPRFVGSLRAAASAGGDWATVICRQTPETDAERAAFAALAGAGGRVLAASAELPDPVGGACGAALAGAWPIGTALSASVAERFAAGRFAAWMAERLVVRAMPIRLAFAPFQLVLYPLASLGVTALNLMSRLVRRDGGARIAREGTSGQPAR